MRPARTSLWTRTRQSHVLSRKLDASSAAQFSEVYTIYTSGFSLRYTQPILDHAGFRIYETSAIALYVDEAFAGSTLQPRDLHQRAKMYQWISAVSSYYYPYLSYHLSHERLIYPALGITPDEKVVAHALPRIQVALDVMDRELETGSGYLVGDQLTLADFFMLPTMTSLGMTPEGQEMLNTRPRIGAWRARMEEEPAVIKVRSMVAPHIGKPVEHARKWVETHRPR